MLYGNVPFKGNSMQELHRLIKKAKYSLKEDISAEARDLIHKMLNWDPNTRLKIPEILMHPWMQNIDEEMKFFNEQEIE